MRLKKKYVVSIPWRGGWRRFGLAFQIRSDIYIGAPKRTE